MTPGISLHPVSMHCAMHWDITAWKSHIAFSIRISMHFDAVIMAFPRQTSLCLTPADFIAGHSSCGQVLPATGGYSPSGG
jgi:hypothetical protein